MSPLINTLLQLGEIMAMECPQPFQRFLSLEKTLEIGNGWEKTFWPRPLDVDP